MKDNLKTIIRQLVEVRDEMQKLEIPYKTLAKSISALMSKERELARTADTEIDKCTELFVHPIPRYDVEKFPSPWLSFHVPQEAIDAINDFLNDADTKHQA